MTTTVLSGSSVDPHDFEPAPSDAAAFEGAQLIVINGGHYDEWAANSDDSWSFRNLVGYFRKIENIEGTTELDAGTGGPLIVSHQRSSRPLDRLFKSAACPPPIAKLEITFTDIGKQVAIVAGPALRKPHHREGLAFNLAIPLRGGI